MNIGGTTIYKGAPCRNGHPGMRYSSSRHCVDCQRTTERERQRVKREACGPRYVSGSEDVPAALFRSNYLAMYAPEVFDAEGWRQTRIGRFDE